VRAAEAAHVARSAKVGEAFAPHRVHALVLPRRRRQAACCAPLALRA
jgi:hypothetical protein